MRKLPHKLHTCQIEQALYASTEPLRGVLLRLAVNAALRSHLNGLVSSNQLGLVVTIE